MVLPSSNWTDLSCQRIKSVGERHRLAAIDHELVLANHVHELNARENVRSRAKGFKAEHWSGHPFDGAMVLFNDVVEVLHLSHGNRYVATSSLSDLLT